MQRHFGKRRGFTPPRRQLCFIASLALLFCAPHLAFAIPIPILNNNQQTQQIPGSGSKQPVMLSADQLGYDKRNALVTAQGNVEVVQGDIIVLADRISYNQTTNEVYASGNVSLREPDGNVLFADHVRLRDNLEAGLIQNFRARMSDNSLFAAREARKISPTTTELDYAVYSPCKVCQGSDPLWQFKAKKVKVDEAEQKVTYRNATLDLWGVPVMWTPYFSHATPDADPKQGFLTPEFSINSRLGTTIKTPYFFPLADNMDATFAPMFNTKEAPVMGGEFRYLNSAGFAEFRGSITDPQKRNEFGDQVSGREVRGHVDATGRFAYTDKWDWGFDIRRTTDDTYLRRYDISKEDLLTSRLFAEGIESGSGERSFAGVQGLAFQRLTDEANPDSSPLVMPLAEYWWQSRPGWMNSRFDMTANTMLLARSDGPQSRRLSVDGGWVLPMIAPGGHVLEAGVSLRGDAYSVQNVPQLPSGQEYDGLTSRLIPEASLEWRYPLINEYADGRSLTLEPVAQVMASPHNLSNGKIPNEDSQVLEFNDNNIFDINRYPGYDLIETGPRANYGLRGLWQFADLDYANFLLGQNFRTSNDNQFPFSNDVRENFSDYIGKFGMDLGSWLSGSYRFRFDQSAFILRRQEFNTSFFFDPLTLQTDYINLSDDPFLGDRQEIYANGALQLTDQWALLASGRRDLENSEMIDASSGVRYQDECLSLFATIARSFIIDRDIEPSTSFLFRVELKNLE